MNIKLNADLNIRLNVVLNIKLNTDLDIRLHADLNIKFNCYIALLSYTLQSIFILLTDNLIYHFQNKFQLSLSYWSLVSDEKGTASITLNNFQK